MSPAGPLEPIGKDDLKSLREQLKRQRFARKASLAEIKKTTFRAAACERRGTVFLDTAELKRRLAEAEEAVTEALESDQVPE